MSSSARRTHVLWLGAATAISGSMLIGAPACAGTTAAASDLAATGPTIEVIGRRPAPLDTETGLSTMATTVQDTPQAINLITSAQLKQQGVTSLEQALKNVPGITIAIGEGGTLNGDQFKIRGFDAANDVFVDGLRDFGVYIRC
jgi:catecholate siderophore receptor